jgi:hypothetical protein
MEARSMATKKARTKPKTPVAKKATTRKRVAKKSAPSKTAARKKTVARKRAGTVATPHRAPRKAPAKRASPAAKRATPRKAPSAKPAASSRRAAGSSKFDASVFPVGDDALRKATGRSWEQWLGVLDKAGAAARSLDHQQIVALAMKALPGMDGWWGQMVSNGYERARGLREKHQSSAGGFQATISKTLPIPLFAAFAAWADQTLRRGWLDAQDLDFTRLNAGRNIRARWPDGSVLDIRFNATGPDKCQIVVDTMKLPDAGAVERAKAFWQEQFERLQAYLRL